MSVTSSAASLLGIVSKAVLVVKRESMRASDTTTSSSLSSLSSALSSSMDVGSVLTTEHIEVEYNPTSLSIMANVEPTAIKSMQQGSDANALVQCTRPPSLVLTVELIFDAVNNQDCFYYDCYSLSVSTITGGISSLATTHTVRPQMEGLAALMLNNDLREVSFVWDEMVFTGQVNHVTSTYTMFNRSGVPVRGTLQFQILQSIGSDGTKEYWKTAFEKIGKGQFTTKIWDSYTGLFNLSI